MSIEEGDVAIEEGDVSLYRNKGDFPVIYTFPMAWVRDPEGGGRVYWRMEPEFETLENGETRLSMILLQCATNEERYKAKLFRVPAHAEMLNGKVWTPAGDRVGFFDTKDMTGGLWRVFKCPDHGLMAMESYVPDGATALVVNVGLSVMADIYYDMGARQ